YLAELCHGAAADHHIDDIAAAHDLAGALRSRPDSLALGLACPGQTIPVDLCEAARLHVDARTLVANGDDDRRRQIADRAVFADLLFQLRRIGSLGRVDVADGAAPAVAAVVLDQPDADRADRSCLQSSVDRGVDPVALALRF